MEVILKITGGNNTYIIKAYSITVFCEIVCEHGINIR